jgi:hypothetical protein
MSSQAFFWVNVGLGLFLVLLFLIGKKGITSPSKLNLRKGFHFSRKPVPQGAQQPASPRAQFQSQNLSTEDHGEKSLNVLFMYNGHNFDAYEVLGVPAGANLQMVERYYQEALRHKGHDRDFIEAAFYAIRMTQPKR